jgi:hypothetical protein
MPLFYLCPSGYKEGLGIFYIIAPIEKSPSIPLSKGGLRNRAKIVVWVFRPVKAQLIT